MPVLLGTVLQIHPHPLFLARSSQLFGDGRKGAPRALPTGRGPRRPHPDHCQQDYPPITATARPLGRAPGHGRCSFSGPQTQSGTEHGCGLIWPGHFLAVQPWERCSTTLSLSFLICNRGRGHTDLKRGQGAHSTHSAHLPAETACPESHQLQETSRESPAAGEDARR